MENKKKSVFTNPIAVVMLSLLACLLWGSAFPSIKTGYRLFNITSNQTFTQLLFAGSRFFLAGVLITLYAIIKNKGFLKLNKHQITNVMKLSSFQTIMQYVFFYIGLAHASATNSSIISATGAFATIIMSSLIFKTDKMTLKKLAGCIIGFTGVLFIIIPSSKVSGSFNIIGEGFILISTLTSAYSAIMIKKFSKDINPIFLCGYQFLFGGAMIIIVSYLAGGRINNCTLGGTGILLYLASLSAVAYTLWSVLLKYNEVSHISIFQFTVPIFGVLLSSFILSNESLTGFTVIALILVSSGIILVNRAKPKKNI